MKKPPIDLNTLYRLPWTLPDNAISWLEPTAACNLHCDGCYRKNIKDSHKSMDEVKQELDVFQTYRNTDCISIAGGDPLLYPDIIELVAEIKRRGIKPIVNTNGIALTKELLHDLKKAGVFGFTFHVDSKQGRKGEWAGKNELELNELRYYYAKMLADEGGISCSFNSTVYSDTLQYVPKMAEWARNNIDIVNTMVFIMYRYIVPGLPFDWYVNGKQIDWKDVMYSSEEPRDISVTAPIMLDLIRKTEPEFSPAAYLNGTGKSDSYKWLLTERIGTKERTFGYMGKKFIELVMSWNHFVNGTYLSYGSPATFGMGRSTLFFLWPFDKKLRKSVGKYFKYLLANPFRIFKKVHMQSILFIQPIDILENGQQVMCDGCPDITVHKGELVWSCRLEEPLQLGGFLVTMPKQDKNQK